MGKRTPDSMTFLEHLSDLRKRIFFSFIAIIIGIFPSWIFSKVKIQRNISEKSLWSYYICNINTPLKGLCTIDNNCNDYCNPCFKLFHNSVVKRISVQDKHKFYGFSIAEYCLDIGCLFNYPGASL